MAEGGSPQILISSLVRYVIAFDIPGLAVAANHTTAETVLYESQATNPYQGWGPGYGKADHAIADIFLLNAAPELKPGAQRADHDGAVKRLCNGVYSG